jgi:uncharacterized 2Fe-2S/4Fe-4S cluster protein (DUF4445 family)
MSGHFHIKISGFGSYRLAAGANLRAALRKEGLYLDGTCADEGRCGRCVVTVLDGDAGTPAPTEEGLLGESRLAAGQRLACRITVRGDLLLSLEMENVLEVDRVGRWKSAFDSPLWRVGRFTPDGRGFGVAVDMGTTSIASALVDLSTGQAVDTVYDGNPLLPWGTEVISRLQAAGEQGVREEMMQLTWEVIGRQLSSLCRRHGVSAGRVKEVVLVGNSAQYVLARGDVPGSLLTPPYSPQQDGEVVIKGSDLPAAAKLPAGAVVIFPPPAGGFAGSDAVVSILAARAAGARSGALIDTGTNSEIAVWKGDQVLVASAAAGPAFEGGHIRCGLPAVEGAISEVEFFPGGLRTKVLGDVPARGVCGTGVVDSVAGMLRAGVLDERGGYKAGAHPAAKEEGLVLASGVILEPGDIETIQKAKAAITATFELLLEDAGLEAEYLDKVYLTGAFGSRLDIGNAVTMGLLPDLPAGSYELGGNSAMAGAAYVLVSGEARKEALKLAGSLKYLNMAEDERFEELYLDHLYFNLPPG